MVDVAPTAQGSPFFALCATAWALVEVPRYAFYVWNLVDAKSLPYALL